MAAGVIIFGVCAVREACGDEETACSRSQGGLEVAKVALVRKPAVLEG